MTAAVRARKANGILEVARLDEPVLHREQRRLGAVLHAELPQHDADVPLHGPFRELELGRDRLVAPAAGDQLQHAALARGELGKGRAAGGDVEALGGASRLADHPDPGLVGEQRAQPLAHDLVIVHQDDGDRAAHVPAPAAGTTARIVVPRPGTERTVSVPPSASARSRMWRSPRLGFGPPPFERRSGSKPTPSSATESTTRWSSDASSILTLVARACLRTL